MRSDIIKLAFCFFLLLWFERVLGVMCGARSGGGECARSFCAPSARASPPVRRESWYRNATLQKVWFGLACVFCVRACV